MSNVSILGKKGALEATTVAVAGLTTIGRSISTIDMESIFIRIDNSNAAAVVFDAFEIQASPDGSNFEALYSVAGDYTSPIGVLIGASSDLTTLAAAASGWFILDCSSINVLRLQASANTTQSVGVTASWSGR